MKKAQLNPIEIILLFVVLAVVAGIIIYIFVSQSGQAGKATQSQIKDTDTDGIPDILDKCPTQLGSAQYQGCLNQESLAAAG